MDHGGTNHGDMDHDMCSMNMVFTWSTQNLCVIFRQWRITGPASLIFSLAGVILLTAGYEFVREMSRQYEARQAEEIANTPRRNLKSVENNGKIGKAALYAVQVFYSFFIMLLFMTYNGWIMLAVTVGAFMGHMIWGGSASKSVACH